MTGKLYVVATPIGNLGDITNRALDVLKSVDLILAEDTRVSKKLLRSYGIATPVLSFHAHSKPEKLVSIVQKISSGQNIALVTDAGTPGISDPGNELIDHLYKHSALTYSNLLEDIRTSSESAVNSVLVRAPIIPIPGASALTAALSVCGFNVREFTFIGFMPKKKRRKLVEGLIGAKRPFVYFDSPHRVIKNLELVAELAGDARVFVGRELTKIHEQHYRGQAKDVLAALKKQKSIKGEVVVVVEN